MRNFFRSHLVIVLGIFVGIPFALWGGLVVADISARALPISASPLEEARVLATRAQSAMPWVKDSWQYYTTAGGGASELGVSFSYPGSSRVAVASPDVLTVIPEGESAPVVLIGGVSLLGLDPQELLGATESTLHGYRLRELRVRRVPTAVGVPSWWTEEHRLFVVDVSETRRLVVEVSPQFEHVQQLLDGLSCE
ncbi:MAG: hypothetical protein KC653_01660 [Candidatus Andersenbacteria bacterium]|nr:hypothetical protein [Candidatus Andersenbacteria bacterium]